MHTNNSKYTGFNKKIFAKNLITETELLNEWFHEDYFKTEGLKVGAEIEFLLLDKDYHLIPHNRQFTEQMNNPAVVAEAGASQLEMNAPVLPVEQDFLCELHQKTFDLWSDCCRFARPNDYHLALIGAMPQAEQYHAKREYITPHLEYYLMNDYALDYRQGMPLSINLQGQKEQLVFQPESLSVEGLISSLQLHLEVNPHDSARYYNVVQMLSAPLLALSCNAPFFFGKNLWSETRIAIFEQLYSFPSPYQNCVFFEPHYLKDNFYLLFENNLNNYPHLLPEVSSKEPQDKLFHLRRQNSYIYRWNRPIVDFNAQKEPYLRIEHRPLSTGPTIVDMIANAALFYGLVHYFVHHQEGASFLIPFKQSYMNFYQAACSGLRAQFNWNSFQINAVSLLTELLPLAKKGLQQLGVRKSDIDYYLFIVSQRLIKKQNGSLWQQNFIQQYGKDFDGMLERYLEHQYSETPVSEWRI